MEDRKKVSIILVSLITVQVIWAIIVYLNLNKILAISPLVGAIIVTALFVYYRHQTRVK